jgi:hypothetical protein
MHHATKAYMRVALTLQEAIPWNYLEAKGQLYSRSGVKLYLIEGWESSETILDAWLRKQSNFGSSR